MKSPRYLTVILLMLLALATLYRRGDVDRVPASLPLSRFPETVGGWTGIDLPIDQETLDVLGQGDFLNRTYRPPATVAGPRDPDASGPVGLFIGYFATQRTGQSIHSPQHCLPGAGWSFESSGVTELTGADGKTSRVGDYLITDGTNKAEVLYWYQAHGRAIANDYTAKFYMLTDSIRYNRSDAALVRVVVPIRKGETRADAHGRAVKFAEQMTPLLPAYIPD